LRILANADRRFRKNPTGQRFPEGHLFNFQKRGLRCASIKARIVTIPLLVFYTVLTIIISGCSAAGWSGSSTPTTLAWEAPSTYENGTTRIEPGELTGYRINIYTDSNLTARYADYLVSGPNPPTSIKLIDLNTAVFTDEISRGTSTTYYLAVTAIVTINGMEIESAPSNSMSYTYP
jgi:hypothetical protein